MPADTARGGGGGGGDLYETHSDGVPDTQLDDVDDYDVVDDTSIQRSVHDYGDYDNVHGHRLLGEERLPSMRPGVDCVVNDQLDRARVLPYMKYDDFCDDDDGGVVGTSLPGFPRVEVGDGCDYFGRQPRTPIFRNREYECEEAEEEEGVDAARCPVTVTVTGELCVGCEGGDGHHVHFGDVVDSPNDSVLDCQHCPFSEG